MKLFQRSEPVLFLHILASSSSSSSSHFSTLPLRTQSLKHDSVKSPTKHTTTLIEGKIEMLSMGLTNLNKSSLLHRAVEAFYFVIRHPI